MQKESVSAASRSSQARTSSIVTSAEQVPTTLIQWSRHKGSPTGLGLVMAPVPALACVCGDTATIIKFCAH